MTRQRAPLVAIAAFVILAAVGAGFVAGRRYPWERLNAWLGRRARTPVPPGWLLRAAAPQARYEGSSIVVGAKIFIFGGFHARPPQALRRVDVYDPASNSWSRRADMPEATTHRNPVLVGDTIWLAGGFVGDNPGPATTHVWKYAIQSDRWSEGPALPAPRGGGALVSIGNSLHYIGGYGADRNASMSEHWTLDLAVPGHAWQVAAPLPRPRGHFASALVDGKLYLIGGTVRHDPVQVDVDWVDRFDVATRRWSAAAPLPNPLSHVEPSTFVRNGRIMIMAGRDNSSSERVQDLMLTYDPVTDRWLPYGRVPAARVAPLGLPVGDTLYFGLGADVTYLAHDSTLWAQPLAGPWHRLADVPIALGEVTAAGVGDDLLLIGEESAATLRYHADRDRWDPPTATAARPANGSHQAGEWLDGQWYVLGGLGNSVVGHVVQRYDPAGNRWSLEPDLPWAAGSAATAVIRDTLFIAGGIDGDTTTSRAAYLDRRNGRWISVAPMPLPRNHGAAATDGRRLYVFGGRGPGSGNGNSVANGYAETQIYDPATNTWTVSGRGPDAPAPMPQARGGTGKAIYVRGEFWVFGGETRDGAGATARHVYDRVDIFDPVRNTWRDGPPMPTARHGIFPVLLGNRIYVVAGGTMSGHSSSRVVEYLDLDAIARSPR